ncbi:MAG: hypothetical protein O7G28_03090, partial [Deltaproteobacteria bacterium]|nr:hypothetical protein [Deltaproteobacteria bacterium]
GRISEYKTSCLDERVEARDRTSIGNQIISATGFESQGPKSFDCKFFVIFVFFVVDKYYHMSQELTV